jgi:ATP-dependent exoDNAse (exonuclease V) alpha subunit
VTINRSQGQEFEKLLFNLTSPSFTHGQLYVALSRIRKSENIKIFCTDEQIVDDNVLLMNTRLFL